MADKLRWGILATGRIAGIFAKGVQGSKLGTLAACGSRSQESADRFGDEYDIPTRHDSYEAEVVGIVESWEELPTGSWYAHGRQDKLWLKRLKLRKADGEITLLVLDDSTQIAKLEASAP